MKNRKELKTYFAKHRKRKNDQKLFDEVKAIFF